MSDKHDNTAPTEPVRKVNIYQLGGRYIFEYQDTGERVSEHDELLIRRAMRKAKWYGTSS
jgi:hypothetical protein